MSSISVITTAKNIGSGIQDKLRKMWGLILKQVGKIKGSVHDLLKNTAYRVAVVPTAVVVRIHA